MTVFIHICKKNLKELVLKKSKEIGDSENSRRIPNDMKPKLKVLIIVLSLQLLYQVRRGIRGSHQQEYCQYVRKRNKTLDSLGD